MSGSNDGQRGTNLQEGNVPPSRLLSLSPHPDDTIRGVTPTDLDDGAPNHFNAAIVLPPPVFGPPTHNTENQRPHPSLATTWWLDPRHPASLFRQATSTPSPSPRPQAVTLPLPLNPQTPTFQSTHPTQPALPAPATLFRFELVPQQFLLTQQRLLAPDAPATPPFQPSRPLNLLLEPPPPTLMERIARQSAAAEEYEAYLTLYVPPERRLRGPFLPALRSEAREEVEDAPIRGDGQGWDWG